MSNKTQVLLSIMQTWQASDTPQKRPFTCGNCHRVLKEPAFHHWVNQEGYKSPLHLCNECEEKITTSTLQVTYPAATIDRGTFGKNHTEKEKKEFAAIIASWNTEEEPVLKLFTCDKCQKELPKVDGKQEGYHIWYNQDGILSEIHLDKPCFTSLNH